MPKWSLRHQSIHSGMIRKPSQMPLSAESLLRQAPNKCFWGMAWEMAFRWAHNDNWALGLNLVAATLGDKDVLTTFSTIISYPSSHYPKKWSQVHGTAKFRKSTFRSNQLLSPMELKHDGRCFCDITWNTFSAAFNSNPMCGTKSNILSLKQASVDIGLSTQRRAHAHQSHAQCFRALLGDGTDTRRKVSPWIFPSFIYFSQIGMKRWMCERVCVSACEACGVGRACYF